MNTAQVEALRALLAPTGWLERTGQFAAGLRRRATTSRGLLIVGTPASEPWHMTAHLADEFRLAGLPDLAPTLVRWTPPPGAPAHLSVGIDRLVQVGRTETLLVVSPESAPAELLERVADARRAGTAIFALDRGDRELDEMAHESLSILPAQAPVSFGAAQHLVSAAMGDRRQRRGGPVSSSPPGDGWDGDRSRSVREWPAGAGQRPAGAGLRGQLARLLDAISGPADQAP